MKKQKQMSPYLFLLGYIILFITNVNAINTLRPNELIFSTGHYIKDGTNVEAGMTSPIPNEICYKKTQKSSCEYTYEQYYVSQFPANPVPGTMNIGLILDENNTEEDLRIMVSRFVGDTGVPREPSIRGFTKAFIDKDEIHLQIKKKGASGFAFENDGIHRAYTNLQVGKKQYGKSLWIYRDDEEDLLTIGGFDSVDWALEPVVANPFSINSITSENSAGTPENPGITYLTEKIEVKNTGSGGMVCLFQGDECHESDDAGLFIEGDVLINKLFGLIGFVAKNSIESSSATIEGELNGDGTPKFPDKIHNTLEIYLDVNMNGCNQDGVVVTYTNGLLQDFGAEDAVTDPNCAVDDQLEGFMITAIGYLGLKSTAQKNFTFWMTEGAECDPKDDTDDSSINDQYSNTGMFDFQTNWNEYASFTFLYTKTYTNSTPGETLSLTFCTNAETGTAFSNIYYLSLIHI